MITLHGHLYQHRHHDRQDCLVITMLMIMMIVIIKMVAVPGPFRLKKLVGICFRGWAELSGKDIHYSNSNPVNIWPYSQTILVLRCGAPELDTELLCNYREGIFVENYSNLQIDFVWNWLILAAVDTCFSWMLSTQVWSSSFQELHSALSVGSFGPAEISLWKCLFKKCMAHFLDWFKMCYKISSCGSPVYQKTNLGNQIMREKKQVPRASDNEIIVEWMVSFSQTRLPRNQSPSDPVDRRWQSKESQHSLCLSGSLVQWFFAQSCAILPAAFRPGPAKTVEEIQRDKNTCPKISNWHGCASLVNLLKKKTFPSPKSSPCTFSVTMQLTDLVDDLLQNMSKQQLRSSKLGFSPTYRRAGFLQHYCWCLKRDVTSAYILYIPKMPYIPKCWQFSSAQIVPGKKKIQTPELPPSISIPPLFFHSDFPPKKKKKNNGLPQPPSGSPKPCKWDRYPLPVEVAWHR